MNTLLAKPLADRVSFSDSEFIVYLKDARSLSIPLAWFPVLANASKKELMDYQVLGDGEGIHWPMLDEDISVIGLLLGQSCLAA
jgi:hypothetical protein